MRKFGTDGVRGVANIDLTAADVVALAIASAAVLGRQARSESRRPIAIIGRDTRPSGYMLVSAISAGLCSAGVDVYDIGVVPTPAVAYLVSAWGADFGVMVSASHNPMPDNGIKFFGYCGVKLSDNDEHAIEQLWTGSDTAVSTIVGADLGKIYYRDDAQKQYIEHLSKTVGLAADRASTSTLTIIIDTANGAASIIAPEVLRLTGANVISINADMSGEKINDHCGSTYIDSVRQGVIEYRADIGIAYDGDADRCLAIDENGQLVDGDAILAILAISMAEKGVLHKNTVVATVMSNYGLQAALRGKQIDIITTPVGDKYVLEEIIQGGYALGGEQSGHIILADYATTGDGILTSLFLALLVENSPLSELASVITLMPQVLINVPVRDKTKILISAEVTTAVEQANVLLQGRGRVLVRPSGTEEIFRVMVESDNRDEAHTIAHSIAQIVAQQ